MLIVALMLVGCTASKSQVEPEPIWRTESGKYEVRVAVAEAMVESNSYAEALSVLRDLRAEGRDTVDVLILQGRALAGTGLGEEALGLLEAAHKSKPKDPRPLRQMALIHADAGRIDLAVDAMEKAVAHDEDNASTWNNLGFLLLSAKRHDEAEQALHRAVELDGGQIRYRNNLGFAQAANGDQEAALRTFRSAGTKADAHANLALSYEIAGDMAKAENHYSLALKQNPSHSASVEALGRLQKATGDSQ